MPDETPTVTDNPQQHRYEISLDGHIAFLAYRRRDDTILLAHTEVPPEFRGRGFGQLLTKHALDEARRDGKQVMVKCPFVTAWLRRHHEYDAIIVARASGDGHVDGQHKV